MHKKLKSNYIIGRYIYWVQKAFEKNLKYSASVIGLTFIREFLDQELNQGIKQKTIGLPFIKIEAHDLIKFELEKFLFVNKLDLLINKNDLINKMENIERDLNIALLVYKGIERSECLQIQRKFNLVFQNLWPFFFSVDFSKKAKQHVLARSGIGQKGTMNIAISKNELIRIYDFSVFQKAIMEKDKRRVIRTLRMIYKIMQEFLLRPVPSQVMIKFFEDIAEKRWQINAVYQVCADNYLPGFEDISYLAYNWWSFTRKYFSFFNKFIPLRVKPQFLTSIELLRCGYLPIKQEDVILYTYMLNFNQLLPGFDIKDEAYTIINCYNLKEVLIRNYEKLATRKTTHYVNIIKRLFYDFILAPILLVTRSRTTIIRYGTDHFLIDLRCLFNRSNYEYARRVIFGYL